MILPDVFLGRRQLQFGLLPSLCSRPPQNLQRFRLADFPVAANNKRSAPKLLLVLAIAPLQPPILYGLNRPSQPSAVLAQTHAEDCVAESFSARVSPNSRMTPERFEPICFAEAAPNFIRNRKEAQPLRPFGLFEAMLAAQVS